MPKQKRTVTPAFPQRYGLAFLLSSIVAGAVSFTPVATAPSVAYRSAPEAAPPVTDPSVLSPDAAECQPRSAQATSGITRLMSDVSQTAAWMDQPGIGMGALMGGMIPQLMAYLNPRPYPEIDDRARLAKVPVMMYHDVLPEKKVFFDVTAEELERHFELIRQKGLTPISMDQLVTHLRTGLPLPEKPIMLSFDDGYQGHYRYVYPLLKKYNYPALFAIYTDKLDKQLGRPAMTWEQVRVMAADPLITISSHSVTHRDLNKLTDAEILMEAQQSKQILESKLGIPMRYFTYPSGKYDQRALAVMQEAGYLAALTMNDVDEQVAGQSKSLLEINRIGQSRIDEMVTIASGGSPLPGLSMGGTVDFDAPIRKVNSTIDGTPFIFISGGKPMTIHAKTRAQLPKILAGTPAIAAVDGGFFSLEFLDSNVMLGPVLSQNGGKFIPGNPGEIPLINKRPLVLIGPTSVKFVPFDNRKHNTLEGVQAEMPDVTDVFVGAGFLVENGQPQPAARFGKLFDFNAPRHRAFWGINQAGQPKIGVSTEPIGSVDLGIALAKAGFRDAVMLDSGASTSLAYKGESLVAYTPRPVPHAVALVPSGTATSASDRCALTVSDRPTKPAY
ncbi:MAG TPA: polysaccharide deacetylase family protein [Thermosynechococcaceae cyanobacterium]